jgi:hypothetical protein
MADMAMDPMKIVGFEGVFGTLLMVGLGFGSGRGLDIGAVWTWV